MQRVIEQSSYSEISMRHTLCGCALLILSSWLRIPFYPVPFTMQTCALFWLALTQSPKQAFASAMSYLLCASIGLPVFGFKANALWMVGKCAGYLIAFPLAALLTAHLLRRYSALVSMVIGQGLIYFLGVLGLTPFYGWKVASIQGMLLFIPSDLLKMLIARALVPMGRTQC